jgi:hypothetical protein
MRGSSRCLGLLALGALGCTERRYADAGADLPTMADASDAGDVPDIRDASDALDADASTDADATVAEDAPAPPDATDPPDASPDAAVDAATEAMVPFAPRDVTLANATATRSQMPYATYGVGRAIDGTTASGAGWAIGQFLPVGSVGEATAAFEFTETTPMSTNGTRVVVTLTNNTDSVRLLNFRIRLTTADRGMFADGAPEGGNVGSLGIWMVPYRVVSATASSGITLTTAGDVVTASGGRTVSTYTITLDTESTLLTGLRLEALRNTAIPGGGPGSGGGIEVGNFVLSEIQVRVVPRP